MARMAKRAAVVNAADGNGELDPEVPGPFDHMDPISRSIMLRRAGGGPKK